MAAGIKITFEVGQELSQTDQSWKLTCTASNSNDTGGVGIDDDSIFVCFKGTDHNTFLHIAKPSDMSRYPDDPSKVAPKVAQYYRASTFQMYFNSSSLLQEAIADIQSDVEYLIKSLDFKETQGGLVSVDFGTITPA